MTLSSRYSNTRFTDVYGTIKEGEVDENVSCLSEARQSYVGELSSIVVWRHWKGP